MRAYDLDRSVDHHPIEVAIIPSTGDDPAQLAEFSEGDTVEYGDSNVGVIVGVLTSEFEWPTGDDATENVNASEDDPVYIVARETGGAKPYRGDELDSIAQDDAFGDIDSDLTDAEKIGEAEMSRVIHAVDDPYDLDELWATRAELVNVPGVDDPEVGWSSYPPSWRNSEKPARLILLDAWTSMGGTFTSCVADMRGQISRPKRFCASMKDEVLGTERWRNRF